MQIKPLAVAAMLLLIGGCAHDETPDQSATVGGAQLAEILPVGMLMAALAPAPPTPVMAEPTAPTGPMYGAHLASYFREADALRGWNVIVGQQSSIGSLKHHVVPIQTAKGPMVRLLAGDFATREEATRFCTWAHQQRLYCAVMALSPDDKMATPVPPATGARRPARRGRTRG